MICNTALNSYRKWFIGNDIRDILLADDAVRGQVGNHIYPIVAAEGTIGDFIVYSRQEYSKDLVKAGVYQDVCKVAVVAVSDNYDNAMTGSHINDQGVTIDITLADSTEIFEDNKYIETLLFTIK